MQKEVNKCLILMQFYFFRPKSQILSENRQMCQKWGILRPKFYNLIEVKRYKGIHCSCIAKKTWKILRILQNIIARLNSACPALVRTIVLAPRTKLLCLYFFTMSVSFGSTNCFKLGLLLLWLVSCSYNITHMHQGSMKRRKILGEGNYIFVE